MRGDTYYDICFTVVENNYKTEWPSSGDKLQGFLAKGHGKSVFYRAEFNLNGINSVKFKYDDLKEPDGDNDKILKKAIKEQTAQKIYEIGKSLVKDLTELGWDGDNEIIWRVFWQKCINQKVLKVSQFTDRACDIYQLEDRQPKISLKDELENAKQVMKSGGKRKEREVNSGASASGEKKPRSSRKGSRKSKATSIREDADTTAEPRERSRSRDSTNSSQERSRAHKLSNLIKRSKKKGKKTEKS